MSELQKKIDDAKSIINAAFNEHDPVKVITLFSGGNDSLGLLDLTHRYCGVNDAGHCNTGIGIEETRIHVRKSCADMGVKLDERHPKPENSYEALIRNYGFPGPSFHRVAYARLKERSLRALKNRYITNGRKERIMFLTGIRGDESAIRARYAKTEPDHYRREGSMVWVNPIYNWTKDDLCEYREHYKLPENPVTPKIHTSGECLCGAFAHPGEREEIKFWFPSTHSHISGLETLARELGKESCTWGPSQFAKKKKEVSGYIGPMCHNCAPSLFDLAQEEGA